MSRDLICSNVKQTSQISGYFFFRSLCASISYLWNGYFFFFPTAVLWAQGENQIIFVMGSNFLEKCLNLNTKEEKMAQDFTQKKVKKNPNKMLINEVSTLQSCGRLEGIKVS